MAEAKKLSLAEEIAQAAAGKDTSTNSEVVVQSGESMRTKSGSGL